VRSGDDRQVCHRLLQRLALATRAITGIYFPSIPWPMTVWYQKITYFVLRQRRNRKSREGEIKFGIHSKSHLYLPSHISHQSPPTMSRVIQPGGCGGKMRVCYTARRKRGLVATSKRMMVEGMTLRAAMSELVLSPPT